MLSVQYYLIQQLQTFCISPKFREQSGIYYNQNNCIPSLNQFLRSHSSSGNFSSFVGMNSAFKQTYYSGLNASSSFTTSLSFLPYIMPNAPPNPENYIPIFFLVNKPSGEGKRDTGLYILT